MKKIAVITGAGFSKHCDELNLPSAGELSEQLDIDYTFKVFKDNGVWYCNDEDITPQALNYKNITNIKVGGLLTGLIKRFKSFYSPEEFHYEKFFQCLSDLGRRKDLFFIREIIARVAIKAELNKHYNLNRQSIISTIDEHSLLNEVLGCFQFRVRQLLDIDFNKLRDKIKCYKNFVDYIEQFDKADVFTLNHDLLHEQIFQDFYIPYCDGYVEDSGITKMSNSSENPGIKIPIFNFGSLSEEGNEHVRFFKLHGSIDSYYSSFPNQGLDIPEKYIYREKTILGEAPFINLKIDPKVHPENLMIHDRHIDLNDLKPKFISGERKDEFIEDYPLTKEAYLSLKKSLENCDEILIIGASLDNDACLKEALLNTRNKNVPVKYVNEEKPFLPNDSHNFTKVKCLNTIDDL